MREQTGVTDAIAATMNRDRGNDDGVVLVDAIESCLKRVGEEREAPPPPVSG